MLAYILNKKIHKYFNSINITASKFLANSLNFSKNISIIESIVNQTQQWSELIKCFKFCPYGRITSLSRHCFGRINPVG